MRVSLTRTVGFHATHRYFVPAWSPAENQARFGWTADEPGHPHDYSCAVTVAGPLDPDTSMILDLPMLDRILAEEVVAPFDGRHINRDVPEFAYGRALPSCEALARHLFSRIAGRLPATVSLVRVRIAEDASLHADCTGDA
jgi:6-pyruvoyltetrahydropterin/6-carboxytetrahydropterin synthase